MIIITLPLWFVLAVLIFGAIVACLSALGWGVYAIISTLLDNPLIGIIIIAIIVALFLLFGWKIGLIAVAITGILKFTLFR